jgi:predicted nucleic-acid-binding protein
MTGLDTNILLRFLLRDDPLQTAQARTLFQSFSTEQPGWVGIATILEIAWVLTKNKAMDREAVAKAILDLLSLDTVNVEGADAVAWAVQAFRSTKADFADCLIAASARAAGCSKIVTFDRIAARDAGMELLA